MISGPEYCAPSTTITPSDIPAMTRLRIGKFLGAGKRAHRKFRNYRAAHLHLRENLLVLLGINYVNPAPEDANRRARR